MLAISPNHTNTLRDSSSVCAFLLHGCCRRRYCSLFRVRCVFETVVFRYVWRVGVFGGWVSGLQRVTPEVSRLPAVPLWMCSAGVSGDWVSELQRVNPKVSLLPAFPRFAAYSRSRPPRWRVLVSVPEGPRTGIARGMRSAGRRPSTAVGWGGSWRGAARVRSRLAVGFPFLDTSTPYGAVAVTTSLRTWSQHTPELSLTTITNSVLRERNTTKHRSRLGRFVARCGCGHEYT